LPDAQQIVAIHFQMANNIADFMRGKPGIQRDRYVVRPEFGFFIAAADVDMRGLIAFVRIEEGAIGNPSAGPSAFPILSLPGLTRQSMRSRNGRISYARLFCAETHHGCPGQARA
jgi:hypothetical protein